MMVFLFAHFVVSIDNKRVTTLTISKMSKLKGKTAIITGGNSGIGFATAELFVKEGAHAIITGRREEDVKEAVRRLGQSVQSIVSDAGKMDDINTLHKKVSAIFPVVDILFVNAGVALLAPFDQTTEELFDTSLNINFKGAFFTIQKLLPLLRDGGSIILNSTILVHSGMATASVYAASKGALLSLNKTLAVELAARNIRVNSISPGPINTPIHLKMGIPEDVLQEFAARLQAKIPLQRFGEASDVAYAALFLASDESRFLTGSEITVDGGKQIAF
jgi:NAD(P)-dependent dehydrogenase (short-subunit alcohol dehydrogenase family)